MMNQRATKRGKPMAQSGPPSPNSRGRGRVVAAKVFLPTIFAESGKVATITSPTGKWGQDAPATLLPAPPGWTEDRERCDDAAPGIRVREVRAVPGSISEVGPR